jgi:hypothetical protein
MEFSSCKDEESEMESAKPQIPPGNYLEEEISKFIKPKAPSNPVSENVPPTNTNSVVNKGLKKEREGSDENLMNAIKPNKKMKNDTVNSSNHISNTHMNIKDDYETNSIRHINTPAIIQNNSPLVINNSLLKTRTNLQDAGQIIPNPPSNPFNDEAFENIIKEFLNINDFPSEPKDKVCLLKKFISIYKKIKDDKVKLTNFLRKISDKLNEPFEEIRVLFEFEYLRNKREGTFANLSKLINKFVVYLGEIKIMNVTPATLLENSSPDCRDKFSNLKQKINEYLQTYTSIMIFFQDKDQNVKLVEKFIPSFKQNKFTVEEGKEKIIKKFKESLDKNKIKYEDKLLYELLITKGKFSKFKC